MGSRSENIAYVTLCECRVQLVKEIAKDPNTMADHLFQIGVISEATRKAVQQLKIEIADDKARQLVDALESKVEHYPDYFRRFCDILRKRDMQCHYADLLKTLTDKYEELGGQPLVFSKDEGDRQPSSSNTDDTWPSSSESDPDHKASKATEQDKRYVRFQCACGMCTCKEYIEGTNQCLGFDPKILPQYRIWTPNHPNEVTDSDTHYSLVASALKKMTDKMHKKFSKLLMNTFEMLERNEKNLCSLHNVKKFVKILFGSTGNKCFSHVYNTIEGKLRDIKTFDKLCYYLHRNYCSWYSYQLIEDLRNEFLFESPNQDEEMIAYNEAFEQFVKRRCFFFLEDLGPKPLHDHTHLVCKVNVDLHELNQKHIEDFRLLVTNVVNIPKYCITLKQVREGCTELIFRVPDCLKELDELTLDQVQILRESKVLELKIGECPFLKKLPRSADSEEDPIFTYASFDPRVPLEDACAFSSEIDDSGSDYSQDSSYDSGGDCIGFEHKGSGGSFLALISSTQTVDQLQHQITMHYISDRDSLLEGSDRQSYYGINRPLLPEVNNQQSNAIYSQQATLPVLESSQRHRKTKFTAICTSCSLILFIFLMTLSLFGFTGFHKYSSIGSMAIEQIQEATVIPIGRFNTSSIYSVLFSEQIETELIPIRVYYGNCTDDLFITSKHIVINATIMAKFTNTLDTRYMLNGSNLTFTIDIQSSSSAVECIATLVVFNNVTEYLNFTKSGTWTQSYFQTCITSNVSVHTLHASQSSYYHTGLLVKNPSSVEFKIVGTIFLYDIDEFVFACSISTSTNCSFKLPTSIVAEGLDELCIFGLVPAISNVNNAVVRQAVFNYSIETIESELYPLYFFIPLLCFVLFLCCFCLTMIVILLCRCMLLSYH